MGTRFRMLGMLVRKFPDCWKITVALPCPRKIPTCPNSKSPWEDLSESPTSRCSLARAPATSATACPGLDLGAHIPVNGAAHGKRNCKSGIPLGDPLQRHLSAASGFGRKKPASRPVGTPGTFGSLESSFIGRADQPAKCRFAGLCSSRPSGSRLGCGNAGLAGIGDLYCRWPFASRTCPSGAAGPEPWPSFCCGTGYPPPENHWARFLAVALAGASKAPQGKPKRPKHLFSVSALFLGCAVSTLRPTPFGSEAAPPQLCFLVAAQMAALFCGFQRWPLYFGYLSVVAPLPTDPKTTVGINLIRLYFESKD